MCRLGVWWAIFNFLPALGESDGNQFSQDETGSGTKGPGGPSRAKRRPAEAIFRAPLSRFHLGTQHKSYIELNILSAGY